MKKSFRIITLFSIVLSLTACSQRSQQSNFIQAREVNYITPIKKDNSKYSALKKDFLYQLQKEISEDNKNSIYGNSEPEDGLFIYKQLMKQNL